MKAFNGQLRVSVSGAVRLSTFCGLKSVKDRFRTNQFNGLELLPTANHLRLRSSGWRVRSCKCILSPSPTSAMWLKTKYWRTDAERASRDRYMTARTQEDVLKDHHVTKEPSVLHLELETTARISKDMLLAFCANRISMAEAQTFGTLEMFGCCQILDAVFIPQLNRRVLRPLPQMVREIKPTAYPELGERFDSLHPIMFGSRRVCEGIAKVLAKKVKVHRGRNWKEFTVIRLRGIDEGDTEKVRGAGWLVEKKSLAG